MCDFSLVVKYQMDFSPFFCFLGDVLVITWRFSYCHHQDPAPAYICKALTFFYPWELEGENRVIGYLRYLRLLYSLLSLIGNACPWVLIGFYMKYSWTLASTRWVWITWQQWLEWTSSDPRWRILQLLWEVKVTPAIIDVFLIYWSTNLHPQTGKWKTWN